MVSYTKKKQERRIFIEFQLCHKLVMVLHAMNQMPNSEYGFRKAPCKTVFTPYMALSPGSPTYIQPRWAAANLPGLYLVLRALGSDVWCRRRLYSLYGDSLISGCNIASANTSRFT